MIDPLTFDAYAQSLKNRIPGIASACFLSELLELEDYIRNLKENDFPILLAVEPSANTKGSTEDNLRFTSSPLLFLLEKVDLANQTPAGKLEAKHRLHALMRELINLMMDDMHTHSPDREGLHLMHNLQPGSLNVDPENNFLGCMGYSLSFQLQTS